MLTTVSLSDFRLPIMKMQKLHEAFIGNEEQCMHYLDRFGLFISAPECPGKNGNPCGRNMSMWKWHSSSKLSWVCSYYKSWVTRVALGSNKFFTFRNRSGKVCSKLWLHQIVRIVRLWQYTKSTIDEIFTVTGIQDVQSSIG